MAVLDQVFNKTPEEFGRFLAQDVRLTTNEIKAYFLEVGVIFSKITNHYLEAALTDLSTKAYLIGARAALTASDQLLREVKNP